MLPAPTGLRSQQKGGPGCSPTFSPSFLAMRKDGRENSLVHFPSTLWATPPVGQTHKEHTGLKSLLGFFVFVACSKSSPLFSDLAQGKGKVDGFSCCFRTEPSDSGPLLLPGFSLLSPTFASRRRFLNSNSSTDLLHPETWLRSSNAAEKKHKIDNPVRITGS